jgi:periplasmic divalent cation tolerance protein
VSARGTDVVLVLVAAPDAATGDRIADELIDTRLAACVKVGAPVRSTYRWKGVVERAEECRVEIVTTAAACARVGEAVRAVHPDEVPEVVVVPVVDGEADYLAWVGEQVDPVDPAPSASG